MKTIIRILLVCSLTFGLLFAGSASAASNCKGVAKNSCAKSDSCSWVEAYKTKTGTKVKSHCRKKPGKAKKATTKTKKTTDKKKTTAKKTTDKTKKTTDKAKKKAKKTTDKTKKKTTDKTKKAKTKVKKKKTTE